MVSMVNSRKDRDLLQRDFEEQESLQFPKGGSDVTPVHHYDSFKFTSYAPYAFKLFRSLFGMKPADFLVSVCDEPLIGTVTSGASGAGPRRPKLLAVAQSRTQRRANARDAFFVAVLLRCAHTTTLPRSLPMLAVPRWAILCSLKCKTRATHACRTQNTHKYRIGVLHHI